MFPRRSPKRWYLHHHADDIMKATAPGSCSHLSLLVPQVILGFVSEADYKVIAKAIRHRVTAIKRERDKMRRLLEEAHSNQKEAITEDEPEPSNQKAEPASNTPAAEKAANQVLWSLWRRNIQNC